MINAKKPKEALELKFREIYESPEWKQLEPIDRAQLMLVAEGVKPGAIIGGDFSYFSGILKKLGLDATLNTDSNFLGPVYMVAKPERLSEYFSELISAPENADHNFGHRLNGKFLGYPECCTEEYCNPTKNLEARKLASPDRFISNVDYEVGMEINAKGSYPEALDYCPPSFTPCGAHCPNALKKLEQWKEIIDNSGDHEAKEELKILNWLGTPKERIHVQEVNQFKHKRELEWAIKVLRESVSNL